MCFFFLQEWRVRAHKSTSVVDSLDGIREKQHRHGRGPLQEMNNKIKLIWIYEFDEIRVSQYVDINLSLFNGFSNVK